MSITTSPTGLQARSLIRALTAIGYTGVTADDSPSVATDVRGTDPTGAARWFIVTREAVREETRDEYSRPVFVLREPVEAPHRSIHVLRRLADVHIGLPLQKYSAEGIAALRKRPTWRATLRSPSDNARGFTDHDVEHPASERLFERVRQMQSEGYRLVSGPLLFVPRSGPGTV